MGCPCVRGHMSSPEGRRMNMSPTRMRKVLLALPVLCLMIVLLLPFFGIVPVLRPYRPKFVRDFAGEKSIGRLITQDGKLQVTSAEFSESSPRRGYVFWWGDEPEKIGK